MATYTGTFNYGISGGPATSFTSGSAVAGVVNYGFPSWIYEVAAGGGQTFTQDVTGSVSPTGTVSAAITFAEAVAGSVGPSGNLVVVPGKLLGGSVAPGGSLLKETGKEVSGGVSPVGSLGLAVTRSSPVSGAVGPTGSLGVTVSRVREFGGTVSPSGELIKKVFFHVSGQVSPSGVVLNDQDQGLKVDKRIGSRARKTVE